MPKRKERIEFSVDEGQFTHAEYAIGRPGCQGRALLHRKIAPAGKAEEVVEQDTEDGKSAKHIQNVDPFVLQNG